MHPHLYIINPDATALVEEMYPLTGNIIGQPETRMGTVKGICINLDMNLKNILEEGGWC